MISKNTVTLGLWVYKYLYMFSFYFIYREYVYCSINNLTIVLYYNYSLLLLILCFIALWAVSTCNSHVSCLAVAFSVFPQVSCTQSQSWNMTEFSFLTFP